MNSEEARKRNINDWLKSPRWIIYFGMWWMCLTLTLHGSNAESQSSTAHHSHISENVSDSVEHEQQAGHGRPEYSFYATSDGWNAKPAEYAHSSQHISLDVALHTQFPQELIFNDLEPPDDQHSEVEALSERHALYKRDLQDISDNSLNDLLAGDDVSSANNRLSQDNSRQILSNNDYERISPTRTVSDDLLDAQDLKDSASHLSGEGQRVLSAGRSLLTRPDGSNSEQGSIPTGLTNIAKVSFPSSLGGKSQFFREESKFFPEEKRTSSVVRGVSFPGSRFPGRQMENGSEGEAVVTPRSGAPGGGSHPSKNPDFQDILTGFVKLLNGQATGPGRAPPRTRINNRGPPRITDVPPIIFDAPTPPAQDPTAGVPFIPLHTSSDFPYTFEAPSSASVGDQIKATKPIAPASSSPPDANINIFNNRPSIQYMNPSKLPTIPDDLRPPTPPAPQPQGQGHPKPDNGHHHHSHHPPSKPHSTSSQQPNVRPESNGYRPDFIEPTKQILKNPNIQDPASKGPNYGGPNHGMNGPNSNTGPNHGGTGQNSNTGPNHGGTGQNSNTLHNSVHNIPQKPPAEPLRETFGSVFNDVKLQNSLATSESERPNPLESRPLRPESERPQAGRPEEEMSEKEGQSKMGNRTSVGDVKKNGSESLTDHGDGKFPGSSLPSHNPTGIISPVFKPDKPPGQSLNTIPTKDENQRPLKDELTNPTKGHKGEDNGPTNIHREEDDFPIEPFKEEIKPFQENNLFLDNAYLSKDDILVLGGEPHKEIPNRENSYEKLPHKDIPQVSSSDDFPISPTPSSPAAIQPTLRPRVNATIGIDHALGQGIASVIEGLLEPSLVDTEVKATRQPTPPVKRPPSAGGYYPRPGIVLDDTEYKPAIHRRPPGLNNAAPGIITAAPVTHGDIFDVTVTAIQGPGGEVNGTNGGQAFVYPVELEGANGEVSVITTAQNGQHFVSIDGKRTYMNLFGQDQPATQQNLPIKPTQAGSYAVSHLQTRPAAVVTVPNTARPSPAWRKPAHPPVRIDTCIVGDDSTCETAQHEQCRTEAGVSSCHCRPGYARRKHREPCHRIVSIGLSLRVDKLFDQRLTWSERFKDVESEEYQHLEFEAVRAMDSALSMTPFSDIFMAARIHNMYPAKNNGITLNMTLLLAENGDTLRPHITGELSKHLQGVIQRRQNNVGTSNLWVDNSPGVVSLVQDINECASPELNDCAPVAHCANVFGSFQCTCPEGTRDPWVGNLHQSGRNCETCDPASCNHRGTCSYQAGQPTCKCAGSFYGAQCEIDGEVLGVAIGASVCALLIILVTLICLCSWSRRWNREQKIGSPVFGYMPQGGSTVKTPSIGGPPYQVSLEDRLRWAQIADAMAHANHYAPEPVVTRTGTLNSTRPSSALFGYSLPHHPVPLPRLRPPPPQSVLRTPESSTSEEEDRTDLLGRNFQVPRPKSRSSVANQSGIYYDVDYEQQADVFSQKSHPSCIPLNTYTMGSRSHYYRT